MTTFHKQMPINWDGQIEFGFGPIQKQIKSHVKPTTTTLDDFNELSFNFIGF